MKWFLTALAFFSRRFTRFNGGGPSLREILSSLIQEATHSARKLAVLAITAIVGLVFFCAGGLIALLDATRQYDFSGAIAWGATLTSGVILMGVSIAILLTVFMIAWPGLKERRAERRARAQYRQQKQQYNPLEAALAALVMDFVKERENKRQAYGPAPTQQDFDIANQSRNPRTHTPQQDSLH